MDKKDSRKKRGQLYALCILLIVVLTACSWQGADETGAVGKNASSVYETEQVSFSDSEEEFESEKTMPEETQTEALKDEITRSLSYVAYFREGEYAFFLEEAGENLDVTETELAETWETLLASARTFSGTETTETTEEENGVRVDVISVHGRYHIRSVFYYDGEGVLAEVDFSLEPLIVEPTETDDYIEIPITLGYDSEKQLNGMLTLPKDVENPPVAILIQGSGANGMDSPIGTNNNRVFADLAWGLAEQGIATIRYDKRSYSYPEDVTDIETEYLLDVADAVRFALSDSRVDGEQLYLIGHSQCWNVVASYRKRE
ncbi:MAG: alpha/beta hydrolase [Lachnospiraceae bacterium]|nr:alpha/beta hydrolase [Lachnospiraceae bacterium]MCD8010809.1 alpha/beta hydrolase [Lachnospiraceae bacterium]